MRILHILRSLPDENLNELIRCVSEGENVESLKLYDDEVNYDDFIEAIFEADKVFTW